MKTVGTFVASAAVAILSAAASVALALGILGAADAPYFAVASNSMHSGRWWAVLARRELYLGWLLEAGR